MKGIDARALAALLRKLPASGEGSFENLVRDLLSRTTGRRFRIAKAGPQGGIDTRTGADHHATAIGVETKRYGMATPLPLDETKSKLRDAAATHADLDLWILVASREIKEPDAGALRREGDALGIEVLILDLPESPELLPAMLLLGAAHRDILDCYSVLSPAVTALLDTVQHHPSYDTQLAGLIATLTQPGLGYANARSAMAAHIRDNMVSMSAAAARMGRYTNLTDPSIIRVDRPAIRQAIAAWWTNAAPRSTLALLGTEGMGKTWAALSWWLDRELAENPLPLTLVVPAKYIASATPDAVIGKALFDNFQTRDPDWWAKRARRWCADAADTKLILILDGLNERFEAQDWSTLSAQLLSPPWKSAVTTILTDRVDHWRLVVVGFAGAGVPCTEHQVGPFSDQELDEILGRAGFAREALDPRLIRLMKVPRLCALALRHWEKLGRSGDITPERLVYEDFRDRIYPDFGDDEMRNLIATIGAQIRSSETPDITVLRRDIREALAEESGAQSSAAAISDIASGIWFSATPGEPNRLKVDPDLAPVAIGLALARAVQTAGTAAEVSRRIEAFVDDLRGLELGITVVGIAASFATIWPGSTVVARDTLLNTWLASDNFSDAELKRYARVIQEAPALFIDRTEAVWRDRQRLHDDRNLHLAGLVNASEAYPAVMQAFAARATLWLSETFGWRDGMNGGDTPAEIAAPAVRARVEAWNAARGALPPLMMIEPAMGEDWVSVAGTTLSAISYLPRAPFAAALGTYAAAMALTREVHYHRARFEWLFRANIQDPSEAEPVLVATARAIAAVPHPDAGSAADLLLDAVCSRDPAAQPATPRTHHSLFHAPGIERTESGAIRWDYPRAQRDPGWGALALRNAGALVEPAEDPDAILDPASLALLRAAFEDVLAAGEDEPFRVMDGVRMILARWAPDLLARYLSRIERIDTGSQRLRSQMDGLKATWIIHDAETTQRIERGFQGILLAAQTAAVALVPDLVVLALAGCNAADQHAAFRAMPGGPTWPTDLHPFLKAPGPLEYAAMAEQLGPEVAPDIVRAWLGLLLYSDLAAMPEGFAPVAGLFAHENADVRTAAIRVAIGGPDRSLCNMLRDSGWTAAGRTGDEAVYGSVALAQADPVTDDDRPSQIVPLARGYLAREWPDEQRYAQAFADHVRDRVDRELHPAGGTHDYRHGFDDSASYARLVAENPEAAETWLQPAIEGAPISFGHMLFSVDKATIELSQALVDAGRPAGAVVWRALMEQMDGSNLKSDDLLMLPFNAGLNAVSEPLRWESLAVSNLDDKLCAIAANVQRADETGWLIAAIGTMAGRTVLDHAKALVLAGELDTSTAADVLWHDTLLARPLPRWLGKVRDLAWRRYRANAHARFWLERFTATPDPAEAFSAFELFRMTAGRSCTRWAEGVIEAARDSMPSRYHDHWLMNVPDLNERLKAADKRANDLLAYSSVPRHDQAPWR